MKKILVLVCLTSILSLSFVKVDVSDDKKFLGSWNGSETDNQRKNLTKHWIQHRFKDGTFVLMFTTIENCEVESFVEKGKWWIKDGLFHELHTNSGKTDIYTYEILDDTHIKFKAKQMSIEQANSDYEFIDTKIED